MDRKAGVRPQKKQVARVGAHAQTVACCSVGVWEKPGPAGGSGGKERPGGGWCEQRRCPENEGLRWLAEMGLSRAGWDRSPPPESGGGRRRKGGTLPVPFSMGAPCGHHMFICLNQECAGAAEISGNSDQGGPWWL